VPFDRPLDPTSTEADDAESQMRRNLGLATTPGAASVPSSPTDPLKGARQAIRSQAIAREYVERQLAHAEVTIQDFRTKLRHARQEKDAAVEAARSAAARKLIAERTLVATEASLAAEKAARDRSERTLRDAQSTIRDLQGRLDAAVQRLETATAELGAERQVRQKTEDALREAISRQEVAGAANRDEVMISTDQRPVGRPRKTALVQSVEASNKPAGKAPGAAKAVRKKVAPLLDGKGRRRLADEQKPIQWWVEGWDRRVT
jgi:hypothetical protein